MNQRNQKFILNVKPEKTDEAIRQQLGGSSASLTEGAIPKHLLRLTIPMLAGFGSMMLTTVIDMFWVAQIGTLEAAVVTLTLPLVMGFMSLSMGFGIGANSIIARTAGSGRWKEAQQIATHTLILVILFVTCVVGIAYLITDDVLRFIDVKEELLPIAIQYTHIYLIGVPILALPMIGGMMLRSFNDARTPAIIMIAGSVLQVTLAPLLIWGIGDFEGFGVYGSAWAFVASRAIVSVYALKVFYQRGLIQSPGTMRSFVNSVVEVMRLAIPSMLTQLLMPISMYFVLALVAQYPESVIAAFGIASRIESLAMVVVMALSSSLGPFVGQNFGSRQYDRVLASLKLTCTFAFTYGLVLAGLLAAFGPELLQLFLDDPDVVEAGSLFLYIVPITMGFMSLSFICGSTFVAFGEPIPSFVLSISRMFVILLPLCYLLDYLMGYVGLFVAMAATNLLSGIAAMYWMRLRTRRFPIQPSITREGKLEIGQ